MILKILKILRSPFPLLDIKFMIMQQRFVFKLSVLVTLQNKISRIYYWIRIDFLLNVMIFQGQFLKPIINIRLFFSKVSAFFSISSYFRLFMHRFSFSISLVSLSLSLSLHSLPSNHISSIQNIITHLLSELSQLQSIVEIQWKQSEQEATDAFIIHSRYSEYGKHFIWKVSSALIRQNQTEFHTNYANHFDLLQSVGTVCL